MKGGGLGSGRSAMVIMFASVLLLARTFMRIFAYALKCIFTYLHIFLLFIHWKGWAEGRECEKGRDGEERENGLLQSEILFVLNVMIAKGLFWFEYKMSLFRGEFRWMMMMIKIKLIITLPFFLMWHGIYGQVVKCLVFSTFCNKEKCIERKKERKKERIKNNNKKIKVWVMVIIVFNNTYGYL